jgi:hypothetical protein
MKFHLNYRNKEKLFKIRLVENDLTWAVGKETKWYFIMQTSLTFYTCQNDIIFFWEWARYDILP